LGVVARSSVATPNLAIAVQSTVGISWLYVLTLYFQEVLGRGALEAGLLFAPMTLAGLAAAVAAGPVVMRWGVRSSALAGLAVVALGLLVMLAGLGPGRPLPVLMAGMVAAEAGFMVSNVSLKVAGTTSIDDARGGLAAGLLNTSIQLGTSGGLAVVTAVMAAARPEGVPPSDAAAVALRWGLGACLAATVLAFLLATRLASRRTTGRHTTGRHTTGRRPRVTAGRGEGVSLAKPSSYGS
jgi:MFS family permease